MRYYYNVMVDPIYLENGEVVSIEKWSDIDQFMGPTYARYYISEDEGEWKNVIWNAISMWYYDMRRYEFLDPDIWRGGAVSFDLGSTTKLRLGPGEKRFELEFLSRVHKDHYMQVNTIMGRQGYVNKKYIALNKEGLKPALPIHDKEWMLL